MKEFTPFLISKTIYFIYLGLKFIVVEVEKFYSSEFRYILFLARFFKFKSNCYSHGVLDLNVTLTTNVKLLNFAKIAITFSIMDRFDWYLDKEHLWHNRHFDFSKCDLELFVTLTVNVKILNLTIFYYNFAINWWTVFRLGKTTHGARLSRTKNWIWPLPLWDLDCQGQII